MRARTGQAASARIAGSSAASRSCSRSSRDTKADRRSGSTIENRSRSSMPCVPALPFACKPIAPQHVRGGTGLIRCQARGTPTGVPRSIGARPRHRPGWGPCTIHGMARPPPGDNKSTGQPEKGGTRLQPAKIAVIGIDLDKNSSSLAAPDANGTVVKRRRMRPDSIVAFAKDLPVVSSPWRPAAARTGLFSQRRWCPEIMPDNNRLE